jgi:hypothetical protein
LVIFAERRASLVLVLVRVLRLTGLLAWRARLLARLLILPFTLLLFALLLFTLLLLALLL